MSSFDVDRILNETMVCHVELRPQVASTNDLAIELASEGSVLHPALIITDQQTGGRGRGANRWWAAAGALTYSLTIDSTSFALEQKWWPMMSLTIGLSICEALDTLVPNHNVQLKWPNDVFLERRKVCGVLIETVAQKPGLIVIGIGTNVNNAFATAPSELKATATSLADVAAIEFDLTDVLVRQLTQIELRLASLVENQGGLAEAWRAKCMLEGRSLRLNLGTKQIFGVCHGIDDEGALLLQTPGGMERCFAGTVSELL